MGLIIIIIIMLSILAYDGGALEVVYYFLYLFHQDRLLDNYLEEVL